MRIKDFLKKNIYLWLVLAMIIILVGLSVFDTFHSIGARWQGVTPMFTGDSYYYYSRIKEVSDGNIFIGNPYFLEHNKEVAPAFFVADWLAAVPLLLGFSFTFTVIFNLFFWSIVFSFLLYLLLRQFNMSGPFCFLGAAMTYLVLLKLMFRPVSMQTVFPFFALFLLSFIIWHKNYSDKKAMTFLILAMTASFYVYTYLWQIILAFVLLAVAYFYLIKERDKALILLVTILISHLLSIPLIIYTIRQVSHLYYWESMERIGLVYSHLPAANVIYSGVWIIIALLLLLFSYRWIKEFRSNQDYRNLFVFSALSGLAMLAVSASNIITGKELENSQHVERFIAVWLIIVSMGYLSYSVKNKINFKQVSINKKIVLFILLLFCLTGIIRYSRTLAGGSYLLSVVNRDFSQSAHEEQDFSWPLSWLENNEIAPKVIWTDSEKLNQYIIISTKHYVLYDPSSPTYIMPSREIEERYLISNYFNDLKQSDIEGDLWDYGGVGNAVHQYKTHNREVKVCRLLKLDKFGRICGELTDAVSFKGKEYFDNLYRQYWDEIKPKINEKLKKYQVAYIIKDKEYDSNFRPEVFDDTELVYRDERFLIYKIN